MIMMIVKKAGPIKMVSEFQVNVKDLIISSNQWFWVGIFKQKSNLAFLKSN